jgi:hypothetical protein
MTNFDRTARRNIVFVFAVWSVFAVMYSVISANNENVQ